MRLVVVVGKGKLLQVVENIRADGVYDVLAYCAHGLDLEAHGYGGVACRQEAGRCHLPHVLLRNIVVHDALEEDGHHHGQCGGTEHQDNGAGHFFLVGGHVAGQSFKLTDVKAVLQYFIHVI